MHDIQHNIQKIRNQIGGFATRYHRKPHCVSLLAVSKGQPVEKIRQAISAGQLAFGENYLQESLGKIEALSEEKIEWHFIGSIQSNKTKKISEHFTWVHTITDIHIAKRLNDQRPDELPPLNICLQVNISEEATKFGVLPKELWPLVEYCATLPRLKLRGLMTIPPPKNQMTEQCKEFAKLRSIYENLNESGFNLDTLSMGMSDDMEAAIAEGATIVRIGTAIFGKRTGNIIP